MLGILAALVMGVFGHFVTTPASAADDLCDRAVGLVEQAALEDAETVAAAVGADCLVRVEALTAQAREASDALVERATRESDDAEQRRLAQLALDLDATNAHAKELLEEVEQVPGRCEAADAAVDRGQFARAEGLYAALDGVAEATSCRQAGLVDLADARSAAWPQRVSDAVTKDGLLLLLLTAIAFGIGVAITAWRRPTRLRPGTGTVLALALLTVVAVVAWHLWAGSDSLGLALLALVLLLAVLTGMAASTAARNRAPLRIEGDEQGSAVARHTITQLHHLAEGRSWGYAAVVGTDLHDTGIRGVLGLLDHPWLAAVLKVWDAVALRSGDRVVLTTDGSETSVAMYDGARLARVRTVDAADFRLDRAKASDGEAASADRDVATGVAAHLLWWRLSDPGAHPRLYGASSAHGLALATVAAQRLSEGDLRSAGALAARAQHTDPGNRAATLALASADLFGGPSAALEDLRLAQLEDLLRQEEKRAPHGDSPLAWRVRYTLAAGLVNREVTRNRGLEGESWRRPFWRALRLWATFLEPGERENLPLSQPGAEAGDGAGVTASFPETLEPHADERDLWRYLVEASRSAAASVAVALAGQPGQAVDTSQLDALPLTGSRTDHLNVACGYSTAYHLSADAAPEVRRRLASRCVQRIRLAAPEPAQRAGVLADPFLAWVKDSEPYRALLADWGLADGPYAGIGSFGTRATALARSHPVPADLLADLETLTGREELRGEHLVDSEVLRGWRGAAQWLAAGVDGSLVDRYQRAGFTDRDQVRRAQDVVVAARLSASAAVSGTEVPSGEERAVMRG